MYEMSFNASADASGPNEAKTGDEPEMIWLREEPSVRRPAHTRQAIAAAALEIADQDGFDAVSMRRVAQRLEAGTMTLYHYVRNKDELVTLMVDAMLAEVLVPDDELETEWRPALAQIAISTREAFRRHRWALDPIDEGRPQPNWLRHFEQSLLALASLDVTPEIKFELINLVDDYVVGFALREAQEIAEQTRGLPPEFVAFYQRQLDESDFPEFRRFLGDDVEAGFERLGELFLSEGRFERGLKRLLDGIEAELDV